MAKKSLLNAMLAGLACAAMASTALFAGPAAAAAAAKPATQQYCVYDASTTKSGCFATQEQAMLLASDGRTTDERNLMQTSGKIIVGRLFRDKNFSGGSYTVTATGLCNPADGYINFTINLPKDWRNVISSVEPYGNCKIWLYPELDLKGQRDGPFLNNTGYIGDFMNNRTKSVGFS